MEYRLLGRSGLAVSRLCLGTMTFWSETDRAGAFDQLDAFVSAGGTFVDTADVYSSGESEEIVGRDGTAWYAEGELVDTIITTAGGEDASKLLPLGRYTLTEVKAPEGYAPDNTPREIELAYADDQTPLVQIRVEVGNTYLPAAITLHKEAEVIRTTEANGEVLRTLHSEPGEGFVFGLFSERDIHENGVTLLADTPTAPAVLADQRFWYTRLYVGSNFNN